MREYCRSRGLDFHRLAGEERRQAMARLGEELMAAVGRVVPVVPVALMATVFLRRAHAPLSELELKAEVGRVLAQLEARHAYVYVPRRDMDYALTVGLRMLRLRRLVEERDGLLSARPEELPLLRYYANSIAHLLEPLDEVITLQ
jgi:glycerol-3-phosphate O-acyltransferase